MSRLASAHWLQQRTAELLPVPYFHVVFHANKPNVMTVSAEEFIRRFLLHALPPGFPRIRYYGLMANCHRAGKLKICRQLLAAPLTDLLPRPTDYGISMRPSPERT